MNTVRKRFSAVKGGKFAQICAPANVYAIVLSDIIGDPLDMIASGPAILIRRRGRMLKGSSSATKSFFPRRQKPVLPWKPLSALIMLKRLSPAV